MNDEQLYRTKAAYWQQVAQQREDELVDLKVRLGAISLGETSEGGEGDDGASEPA